MDQEFVKYNLDLKEARRGNGVTPSTEDLGYKCVYCGKHVSGQVVRFFNGDVEHVLCYECQTKK